MSDYTIERVELQGIHRRYDLDISFNPNLNILYGENGTGKSTLIHIIANIANCDFIRFAFLEFYRIKVTYSTGDYICIFQKKSLEEEHIVITTNNSEEPLEFTKREAHEATREMEDERYEPQLAPEIINKIKNFVQKYHVPAIKTSYFPAFRTMLEAWNTQNYNSRQSHLTPTNRRREERLSGSSTAFSRNIFGQFLPIINYPSPLEIENRLNDEIGYSLFKIAKYESSIFSESFVKVFSALLEGDSDKYSDVNAESLIEEISQLTNDSTNNRLGEFQEDSDTYRELRELVSGNNANRSLKSYASGALIVYRDALKERKLYQHEAFERIEIFFEVVNSFLSKKKIDYKIEKRRRSSVVRLNFPDGSWSGIKVMSSGERQLLTMLYAVNRMNDISIVLIDEPEISLHIDWQEDLLSKMMEQLGGRQIIVCTHSPAIAADFKENMIEVVPIFNDITYKDFEDLGEYEDEDNF